MAQPLNRRARAVSVIAELLVCVASRQFVHVKLETYLGSDRIFDANNCNTSQFGDDIVFVFPLWLRVICV